MSSGSPSLSPGELLANLAALVTLLLGGAWLVDKLSVWSGHAPWAVCGLLSPLGELATAAGVMLAVVGFVGWACSLFANVNLFGLMVAGLVLPQVPGVFLHYLGAGACGT